MSEKTFVWLGIAAAVLVVLTVFVGQRERTAEFTFRAGQHLVTDLDPARIDTIEIHKGEDSVVLKHVGEARAGGQFLIADLNNYQASTRQVSELIANVLSIKLAAETTTDPDEFAALNVADSGDKTTTVSFKDADGKLLVGVVLADAVEGNQYARLEGSDTAYRIEGFASLRSKGLDYVDRVLLQLQRNDVAKVEVAPKDGQVYSIDSPEAGKVELQGVPEGMKVKGSEPDSVFGATSYLNFSSFEPVAKVEGLEFAQSHTVTTRDQREYRIELAQKDEKWWARVKASYLGPKQIRVAEQDTDEQLKEKEALAKSSEAVADFNEQHQGWVYEIPDWKAKSLVKAFDELVEADDGRPSKITASHILIAYQGAERAAEGVTRTKDEAKARAEELLKEVEADPSRFADLARENSDGPTGPNGGDLGEFTFETMAPPFSEAAFALQPGDICDHVVETPFGFHVIQRTN